MTKHGISRRNEVEAPHCSNSIVFQIKIYHGEMLYIMHTFFKGKFYISKQNKTTIMSIALLPIIMDKHFQ